MNKLVFDGYNLEEIAKATRCNVTMPSDTITANCSEKYPEGFQYPYAAIETDEGTVKVRVTTEVPEHLIVN